MSGMSEPDIEKLVSSILGRLCGKIIIGRVLPRIEELFDDEKFWFLKR